jgi:predicted NAD-dependent protein-ADP-ribosyltransferase YbiA (DUF1768 family)
MRLPEKVISGGQTGADQSGLIAAARYGIATGGWMPRGFRTLAGPDPELAAQFGLREHPSEEYPERTELNVRISDGTIRFEANWKTPGEICTLKSIRQHGKSFLDVDIKNPRPVEEVVEWIRRGGIKTLNVAGNPEPKSRTSQAGGITDFVIDYLGRVFEALGHHQVASTGVQHIQDIITFRKAAEPYGWLGNMSAYPLEFEGQTWRTAEALFQALRFSDTDIRALIWKQKGPMGAKLVAKSRIDQATVTPLSEQDLANMRLVLRLKVQQHPELLQKLQDTGGSLIVEACSNRRASPWGAQLRDGQWVGQNLLASYGWS